MRNGSIGLILLAAASAWAGDPSAACRVKKETFELHGAKLNNAGCVIARDNNGVTEFLLVYVNKTTAEKKDEGWGLPGGGAASRAEDAKQEKDGRYKSPGTYAISTQVSYDYVEPAVCTASRETREELGFEVIVGDLVMEEAKFLAFECTPNQHQYLRIQASPQDQQEVKVQPRWFTAEEAKKDGVLRFKTNAAIIDAYLARQ